MAREKTICDKLNNVRKVTVIRSIYIQFKKFAKAVGVVHDIRDSLQWLAWWHAVVKDWNVMP